MRGYWGIGVYNLKNGINLGTLWRSAFIFGADFLFTIGRRYKRQASDTTASYRHVPLFAFLTVDDFLAHVPFGAQVICVEMGGDPLTSFVHPERAVYILGAEDSGLPEKFMAGRKIISIESRRPFSLNVATAGSIVMHDRLTKEER